MVVRVQPQLSAPDPLALIAHYYDACSAGDAEAVAATTCEDVVHWFLAPNTGSKPVRGAEHPQRVVTRGAEWFVLRGDLIAEIRSYYRQDPADAELEGFPYARRGYSVHGSERSNRHAPKLK